MQVIQYKNQFQIANHLPFVVIGGLNVLENEELTLETCEHFVEVCTKLRIPFIFKASFDKANRTSIHSYRGVGLEKGVRIFEALKKKWQVPILTDIHEVNQAEVMDEVCDFLQLPAFLARQTDLVKALAATKAIINIKKPQFLAPKDMKHIVDKFNECGKTEVMICERGTSFGYHNLVVDFLGFETMKAAAPLIFDATHALQTPTSNENRAGGRGELIESLAKAAMVQRIAGLFIETYPDPKTAKCDGDCALPLERLESFLLAMQKIDRLEKVY